jgi:hypothetical protein
MPSIVSVVAVCPEALATRICTNNMRKTETFFVRVFIETYSLKTKLGGYCNSADTPAAKPCVERSIELLRMFRFIGDEILQTLW